MEIASLTACKTVIIVFIVTTISIFFLSSITQKHQVGNLYSSSYFPFNQINLKRIFPSSQSSQKSYFLSPSPSPSPSPLPSPSVTTDSPSNTDFINGFHSISINSTTETNTTGIKLMNVKKSSDLERIEQGLAKAREAIKRAIQFRNVSYWDGYHQDFIPNGPVYRNPYAFHQSHIEMEKRFKIWSYKEGDLPLVHVGPANSIYSSEGQFIDEIEGGQSPFIAQHPDQAHVFFLPFSVANVIQYVYKPVTDYSRDRLHRFVEDYVTVIANRYPYWNRSSGGDHFMVSCHDWAPDVSTGNPELFKNFIRVLCNANTSEGFHPERDVTLPEINLPFGHLNQPVVNERPSRRHNLAFFAGGAHGYVRQVLLQHWEGKDDEIQVYQHLPKGLKYANMMGKSKFCLCASGYEVASPRIVESIRSGCVPVIISDYYVLPFSDVLDWSKFSVFIPVKDIPKIKEILKSISMRKYMKLRNRLGQVERHFTLNRPAKRFDVIHMILHSIWLRRLNVGLVS